MTLMTRRPAHKRGGILSAGMPPAYVVGAFKQGGVVQPANSPLDLAKRALQPKSKFLR